MSIVDTLIADLPPPFDGRGFEDPQHHTMISGPAHASIHLGFSIESDSLQYGGAAPKVLAGFYALWDLLLGDDEQWLYTPFDQRGLVSFDHSLRLARGPGDWNAELLMDLVDTPWPIADPTAPVSHSAVATTAENLRQLTSHQILELLHSVPVQWEVPKKDLETLGWFIYCRREAVAQRLEALPNG